MKKSRYFLLVLALVIGGSLFAQSQRELSQLMRDRGEYYFTLSVEDPSEIQTISRICSVDGTDGRTVVAYANQKEFDKLLELGYEPNLQTPPSLRASVTMWNGQGTYNWDSYLTYDQYVTMMEGFPNSVTNGANCTLLDLGTLTTSAHRRILGIRLNNGQPDGKPKFLYTSTMHGDEVTGMILMLRLINEFCTSNDSRIANILNNVDLFIFPNTNPDGTYKGGNSTVGSAQRYNGNNVDLNRHFPDFDDGAHPDGASSYQNEAQWMMNLAQEYLFTMGANYHGGAEVVNYPWDTYQPVHPDDAWWRYVSAEYVSNARAVSSSYMTDTYSSGITNGYAWYTITGSRQDYMNYYGQCRELTLECSSVKTPTASELPNFWNYNHNAMLAYIEQCLNGIHGVVYAANSRETIEGATITVLDHDALGSSVTSHAVGDFHRPIKGGTWTLKISKEGYDDQQITVTVADGQRQDIEVYITPEGSGSGDDPITPPTTDCYEQVIPSAAGDYVMGYLNGTTILVPTHNSSSSVTTTTVDVTTTSDGFSVDQGTTIPQVTLTAYGSGQYYIKYNNRYLTRSSNSGNLSWGTSTTSSGSRWYINNNGIYVTRNNSNYYLYYSNGFKLSTTQQNNIKFYVEGDCPVPQYAITVAANPAEGGNVEGAGTYDEGQTCTLTATANEGYTFVNWTKEGTEVSTQTTYSFTVMEAGAYVANFAEIPPASPNEAWVPNTDFPGEGMAVVAQIKIEGELLDRDTWELGAFCNDECRACVFPLTDMTADNLGYFAYMNIAGNDGDEISFRLYDAVSGTVIEAMCYTTVELVNGGTLGMDVNANSLFVLNFTTEEPTLTQTVTLVSGTNWFSTYVDITLDDLKAALVAALPGTSIKITSRTQATTYNESRWRGTLTTLDVTQMYMIEVTAGCEITLEGTLIDPAEHPVTIIPGANWIAFPLNTGMTPTNAFAGFAVNGDKVTSRTQATTYNESHWRGTLGNLAPGQGYIYNSAATEPRIFIFPTAK